MACDSRESLAHEICQTLALETVVLARIWLCAGRFELRLTASAGHPAGGGSYHRTDGTHSRLANGVGKIGRVAAGGEPFIVRDLRGDEDWLANPDWIARQGVRGFAAYPLTAHSQVFGVMGIFSRVSLSDADIDDLRFLADFTATRLHALSPPREPAFLTRSQLKDLEKRSITAALARTSGKVFGTNGAAALLGVKPTTLASRIKALGIEAP